jgi:carbonic anhydrase/acetyltransferase-like protein (isoleucine patch superfamily)
MGFPLTIGEGTTIGHHAILHGCFIGSNTLIGMGATILNGARIGANSIVGANALVTEGKEFPDGSLIVGSPAKVVRSLDAESIQRLRASATRYVQNGRRFAGGLVRIDEAPANI